VPEPRKTAYGETILNRDPIEVITMRVLPGGEVEALLRLSERDMDLVRDPHPRYSIAPNPPVYYVDGDTVMVLDGGPAGEAAEHGRDIERAVHARFRQERLGEWVFRRCQAVVEGTELQCFLGEDHQGPHTPEGNSIHDHLGRGW